MLKGPFLMFLSLLPTSPPNLLREGWIALLLFLLLLSDAPAASPLDEPDLEVLSRGKAHHQKSRFTNPWPQGDQTVSFGRLLKWMLSPNPYAPAKRNSPQFSVLRPPVREILTRGDSITYLGHATFWIHLQDKDVLTDPVFGNTGLFFSRHTPFPLSPSELPCPQVVLISHSHYDHLDKDSLRFLGTKPLYITPLGYKDWFSRNLPGSSVKELDWFEEFTYEGISFRFLPAQHWTKRTPFDTNRRLWGSWLIEGKGRKIFFSGDSGYFYGFKEYGRKFGPLDAAILPIGAYEPRWFMKGHHMNPGEAVRAFLDLRAQVFIPQQWGVFDLTSEPLNLPPSAFREAAIAAGVSEDRAPLLRHGETWFFPERCEPTAAEEKNRIPSIFNPS
jgi:L-ascorbate metabolism protein UlaG (beta-lactamase superfamily)